MKLKVLVGAGDRIIIVTLPFAVAGIALNVIYPNVFKMDLGQFGTMLGTVFLIVGVPIWLTSAIQVLVHVPRNRLITKGPFAIVLHPLYTSVALLVIPGIGFAFDTWVGIAIGGVMYMSSRRFSVAEDKMLAESFPDEYKSYRANVLIPWL